MTNGFGIALLARSPMECAGDTAMSKAAPETVGVGQMPAVCRGAAAAAFSARPTDVITLAAEPDRGMDTVPCVIDGMTFACTFDVDRRLVGIDRA